jgi:hypothetical protein
MICKLDNLIVQGTYVRILSIFVNIIKIVDRESWKHDTHSLNEVLPFKELGQLTCSEESDTVHYPEPD